MKKLMILRMACMVSCIGITLTSSAQHGHGGANGPTTPVKLGSVTVNGGIGVGSSYEGDYYNSPFGLKAAIEWGLWEAGPGVITLGGEFGGSFSSGGYQNYNNYSSRTIIVAARAAWHYGWEVPGLDTYGGVSAGLGFPQFHYNNPGYFHSNGITLPVIFLVTSYFLSTTFCFT